MPGFKDEHIIIIAPGSYITQAQLGLPESFTPPRVRIKSRMFPSDTPAKFEPYRIRPKPRKPQDKPQANGSAAASEPEATDGGAANEHDGDDDATLEEDPISDAGAVWPIQAGRIVDWPAFFALMQHVHNMLGAGFHTPILLIAQPAWTPTEHIRITRFFFEKFKCPAFALMDAAQAMCYAYGVHTACVVDIGRDKADVTAVSDFLTHTVGRGIAIPDLGGEAMTQHLLSQLKPQGWDRDMCEQLKMSHICEVLPAGVPVPGSSSADDNEAASANPSTTSNNRPANPASQASTGADGSGAFQRHSAGSTGEIGRGPGHDESGMPGEVGEEDNEGVIDVARIVAGGKTSEYLAKREREKADKAAQASRKKSADAAAAQQAKAARMKNSEREFNSFVFDDRAARERSKDDASAASAASAATDAPPPPQPPSTAAAESAAEPAASAAEQQPPAAQPTTSDDTGMPDAPAPDAPPAETKPPAPSNPYTRTLTAGPARFAPLPPDYLPQLTTAIHTAIHAVPSPNTRQLLWDHILLCGSGARLRGLRDALLAALSARFLVSPSSASFFTSEPPSSFGTPGGTGANTPLPSGQAPLPAFAPQAGPFPAGAPGGQLGGVNPLLYAATTARGTAPAPGGLGAQGTTPRPTAPPPGARGATPVNGSAGVGPPRAGTSQTPTSVKAGRLPEYFGEWKDAGAEYGAAFLGAQVAAKCIFLADVQGGSQKGFMSRSDYNEHGPNAIPEYSL